MKLLACLLLFAAPVFCDTLYTFSGTVPDGIDGTTVGFAYDATTGTFPGSIPATPLPFAAYAVIPSFADWPWDIYQISFVSLISDAQPSMNMFLYMIDDDGSYEPISAWYDILGFSSGDFGTYTAYQNQGGYGLPDLLTLTVSDPPPASNVPEPATFALIGLVAVLAISLRYFNLRLRK